MISRSGSKDKAEGGGKRGSDYPAPRFTVWALIYFLGFFAVPLLGLLALADYGLYRFFRDALGSCYGLGCLF